jgi:PST family polysaccharide transporter
VGSPRPLFERARAALLWRFTARFAGFGLRLAIFVLLARLVAVDAFGLATQALVVIGLTAVVSEIGMAPALIQRRQLSDTHIRVAFTASLLCGVVLTAFLWLGAPFAARVCGTPEMVWVLRLISFTFLLTPLGSTAGALLQRRLAFRKLFFVDLVCYLAAYGGVGVTLAVLGCDVWALAWPPVIEALLRSILLYAIARHPLRPSLARAELRDLLHFGAGMTMARLANYTALTADNFTVGRWLGTTALGLYARAYRIMSLPITEFSDAIGSVLFPTCAEVQDQPDRLRRASLAAVSLTALVVFPLLAALAIGAPELVVGVFGAKWAGAVQPLQILCLGGAFRSIYSLGDSMAQARGAVYSQSWRQAVYALLVMLGSWAGTRWGINRVAVGVVVALAVMYLLMMQLSTRLIQARWISYLAAQGPGIILAAAVGLVALPVAAILRAAHLPELLVFAGIMFSAGVAAITAGVLLPRRWHDPAVLTTLRSIWRRCAAAFRSLFLKSTPKAEPAPAVGKL